MWFSILKGVISIAVAITKHMERRGLMKAGAAEAELKALHGANKRIHNAKKAYDDTDFADDGLLTPRKGKGRNR